MRSHRRNPSSDRVAFSIIMGPRKGMKERILSFAMRLPDADLETVTRTFHAQGPALWRYWVQAMEARQKAGMSVPDWMHPRRNPSKTTPRIYVANLAAYNAGRLKGEWIEPSTDVDELREQVADAIGGSVNRAEWAFHDYDDFPDMGEHPSLKDVAAMAKLLEEHPYEIVVAAQDFVYGNDMAALKAWLDEGYGIYESERDYVEQYIANAGGVANAVSKDQINFYFDYDAFGHDVSIDADEEDSERYEGMSDSEIGESVIDEVYGDRIPKDLVEQYFDYDAFARDVFMEIASRPTPEGVIVFNAR